MFASKHMLRRSWLQSALAGIAAAATPTVETFRHENILGTTLELVVEGHHGQTAFDAALHEVERLRALLSTYDPTSSTSRWLASGKAFAPPMELVELLDTYDLWQRRTAGAISATPRGQLDINALGKSLILDRAFAAAQAASGGHAKILLNIGGDIRAAGDWDVDVTNPLAWYDNATPLSTIRLNQAAVATSGSYERGAGHIVDPRTGKTGCGARAATVIAPDAVTANALSTALCVLDRASGERLVARTPGAAALAVEQDGTTWRTAGFRATERSVAIRPAAASNWPQHYQVTITLTLKAIEGYRVRRPYVAVWAEDASGKVVRNITVWTERRRWLPDLFEWWKKTGSAGGGASVTRATRPPGRYQLQWDGMDDEGKPLPAGSYRISVESNREHGSYAKESGLIQCGGAPASITLKANSEFDAVEIHYSPGGEKA
jgi:FAD:protein FMN transferase